jgi:hypothetical protein
MRDIKLLRTPVLFCETEGGTKLKATTSTMTADVSTHSSEKGFSDRAEGK